MSLHFVVGCTLGVHYMQGCIYKMYTIHCYLVVRSNRFLALLTIVGKKFLVAGDTVGMFLLQDVSAGNQLLVTVVAGQVVLVVVLIHGFGVLTGKYQLKEERKKCN